MLDFDTDNPRGLGKAIKVGDICTTVKDSESQFEGAIPWLYQCLGYNTKGEVFIMKFIHISGFSHPDAGDTEWLPVSEVFSVPRYVRDQFHLHHWSTNERPPLVELMYKPPCKEDLGSPLTLSDVSKKVQLQFDCWNRIKSQRDGRVSSYILMWNDFTIFEPAAICHSSMQMDFEEHSPNLIGELIHIYTAVWDMSEEYRESNPRIAKACKAFQEYFFLHSPFTQYFEGQSLKGIFRDGLRLSPYLDSNLLMHIITWTRQPWEYPQYIVTWKDLVDRGVRPDVAMVTSQLLDSPSLKGTLEKSYDPDYYDKPINPVPNETGHSPFDGETLVYQDIIGLCNQELNIFLQHSSYEEALGFSSVWKTFSIGNSPEDDELYDGSIDVSSVTQDLTPLRCEFHAGERETRELCEWSGEYYFVKRVLYGEALETLVEYSNKVIEDLGERI